jgi:hypothetical protein
VGRSQTQSGILPHLYKACVRTLSSGPCKLSFPLLRQAEAEAPGAAGSARPLWGPHPKRTARHWARGKRPGAFRGRKRPAWPRHLGLPTPLSRRRLPRVTSPVAFPDRPAPARLTPVFPPHLPRTGVRRPAARPAHRPGHPPRPAKTNPLAIPYGSSRVARGGLEGPGREVAEACRGLPAAARTRCQEAQGRGGAGGVAESMDGHLVEGALAVGVHGTPSFLTP